MPPTKLWCAPSDVVPFAHRYEPPFPDESLLGFVTRVCDGTTVLQLGDVLGLASVKMRTPPSLATRLTSEREIGTLARLLGTSPDEIRLRIYTAGAFDHAESETIEFFGVRIRAQYRRFNRRSVSPLALKTAPYHRAIWDLQPFSFDPDTMEKLVSKCPECGRDLGWKQMRGVVNCERCIGVDGLPKVDLREHPQPTVAVTDPEALQFVIGLVHPSEDRKARSRALLSGPWSGYSNSDIFEGIMAMASGLLPEQGRQGSRRPRNEREFEHFKPEYLALAGRAVIGGIEGFSALCEVYRKNRDTRQNLFYGVQKELGPLAHVTSDKYVAPKVRAAVGQLINEYCRSQKFLLKSKGAGVGHLSEASVDSLGEQGLYTIERLSRMFKIKSEGLRRLARSGTVRVVRASKARLSPVLMAYSEVAEAAAQYADSILDSGAAGALGIPRGLLPAIADLGYLDRLSGKVLCMTFGPTVFTRSSVERLRSKMWDRVRSPVPPGGTRLRRAATWLGFARPPWLRIIVAIIEGRLEAFAHPKRRTNILKHLFVRDVLALQESISVGTGEQEPDLPSRIDICTVAEILKISEAFVWRLAKRHPDLLPKHDETYAPFSTSEVEALAKSHIFVPEISRRTGIAPKDVRKWLQREGVNAALALQKDRQLAFHRGEVERRIAAWNKKRKKPSIRGRYSASTKIRVIRLLEMGLSVPQVAAREQVGQETVRGWAKRWRKEGTIRVKRGAALAQSWIGTAVG